MDNLLYNHNPQDYIKLPATVPLRNYKNEVIGEAFVSSDGNGLQFKATFDNEETAIKYYSNPCGCSIEMKDKVTIESVTLLIN